MLHNYRKKTYYTTHVEVTTVKGWDDVILTRAGMM